MALGGMQRPAEFAMSRRRAFIMCVLLVAEQDMSSILAEK
jgi:hypothetical protein